MNPSQGGQVSSHPMIACRKKSPCLALGIVPGRGVPRLSPTKNRFPLRIGRAQTVRFASP